jgi:hypothetical protein
MLCISYHLYFTCPEVYPYLSLKPPITMDSVSPGTIPSLTRQIINFDLSMCILFTSQVYALSIILPASPKFLVDGKSISFTCVTNLGQSILPPWICAKSTACIIDMYFTMATSQNIRKGARSSRNVGPEPQKLALVEEYLDVRAYFE